ncbi:hypothetical protein GO003_023985 [Methylicorpusculum oleiharenae]|uniref:hypothetical protein n=1 Tax=Methylicorpusculum oleiharenae TaxID=1338687 RepID=UPI001E38096A|nr:hypothetical protein [Methylicorpusculum oleiharenae]MCD2453445.1 hypothetical protein [Methylicorpusculum oleiharenae]
MQNPTQIAKQIQSQSVIAGAAVSLIKTNQVQVGLEPPYRQSTRKQQPKSRPVY